MLDDTFSPVKGYLNGAILEIENASNSLAIVHYEIQVNDTNLPTEGNFNLTSPSFTSLDMNNGGTHDVDSILAIQGNMYLFGYRNSACKNSKLYLTLSSVGAKPIEFRYPEAKEGSTKCSDSTITFANPEYFQDGEGVDNTSLTSNTVYGVDFLFLQKVAFGAAGGRYIFNRRYNAQNSADTSQTIESFFRTTGIIEDDLDVSSITYRLINGSIILSIPSVSRAIQYEIGNSEVSTPVTLRQKDIDGSDFLLVTFENVSSTSSVNFSLDVTTKNHDDSNSNAQATFTIFLDFSLCSSCSNYSECKIAANGTATCICLDGYEGDGSTCVQKVQINCESSPCHDNATCTNTEGIFEGDPGYACTCKTGFTGNGTHCEDAVECGVSDNCHSNAKCEDTDGSYICTCEDGYSGNGTVCFELECAVPGKCHKNATCIDFDDGSYNCTCKEGYTGNGTTCFELHCAVPGKCHRNATCIDFDDGTYNCTCNEGYTGNGAICFELQCAVPGKCHKNATCIDFDDGTYNCTCNEGFTGNGATCFELQCAVPGKCHKNATCIDFDDGTYNCTCNEGYTGNGATCFELQCAVTGKCHKNATCIDFDDGTYNCTCNEGYTGNGATCFELQCAVPGKCHKNAACTDNFDGTFRCTCNSEYTGNGSFCSPLPESCTHKLLVGTTVLVDCTVSSNLSVQVLPDEFGSTFSQMACNDSLMANQFATAISSNGTAVLSGLIPGSAYQIIVRRNQSGEMTSVLNDTFISGTVSPPTPTFSGVSDTAFQVRWNKYYNGTAFTVNVKSLEKDYSLDETINTTASQWEVPNLLPGRQFEVCIGILFCKAQNQERRCNSTFTLPEAIGNVEIEVTSTSVTATWQSVRGATKYTAILVTKGSRRKRNVAGTQEISTNETNVTFTALAPGTAYQLTISGVNAAGTGSPITREFETKSQPPDTTQPTVHWWWWIILVAVVAVLIIIALIIIIVRCRTRRAWNAELDLKNKSESANQERQGCCSCWSAIFQPNPPTNDMGDESKHRHNCCSCWSAIFNVSQPDQERGTGNEGNRVPKDEQLEPGCCSCWRKRLWITRHQSANGTATASNGEEAFGSPYTTENESNERQNVGITCCPWIAMFHVKQPGQHEENEHTNGGEEHIYDTVQPDSRVCCPWRAIFWTNNSSAQNSVHEISDYDFAQDQQANACCPWTAKLWINRPRNQPTNAGPSEDHDMTAL